MYQDEVIRGSEIVYSSANGESQPWYAYTPPQDTPAAPPTANQPSQRTLGQTLKGVDWNKVGELIKQGVDIAGVIPQKQKTELEAAIRARCGVKFWQLTKKQKQKYASCVDQVTRQMAAQYAPQQSAPQYYPPAPKKKGLSTGAWVAIGLGVVAVGVLGFLVVKKMRSAK